MCMGLRWSKLLILSAIFLISSISTWAADSSDDGHEEAHREIIETKHLQVLINIADPSCEFFLFNGVNSVTGCSNVFNPRPIGSYYILNGLIFPGDTVDPNQANYTFSKKGVPLTSNNSLGDFWISSEVIFPELNLPQVPATPTALELFECDFRFKPLTQTIRANNFFTYGFLMSNVLSSVIPAQPLLINNAAVQGGTGLNSGADGSLVAKVFFQPAIPNVRPNSLLVDVFFECPVSYKSLDCE